MNLERIAQIIDLLNEAGEHWPQVAEQQPEFIKATRIMPGFRGWDGVELDMIDESWEGEGTRNVALERAEMTPYWRLARQVTFASYSELIDAAKRNAFLGLRHE
ncbi:hypothetical protein SAMN06309944_1018 [Micrococcales bacterium KH10]|nr:hypothetical protein SAMN06309944_1018 [Micrococcales bacterium KH10]